MKLRNIKTDATESLYKKSTIKIALITLYYDNYSREAHLDRFESF